MCPYHVEKCGDPHCGQEESNGRDEAAHDVLPTVCLEKNREQTRGAVTGEGTTPSHDWKDRYFAQRSPPGSSSRTGRSAENTSRRAHGSATAHSPHQPTGELAGTRQ